MNIREGMRILSQSMKYCYGMVFSRSRGGGGHWAFMIFMGGGVYSAAYKWGWMTSCGRTFT